MFAVVYEEAAEEDLKKLRRFDRCRVLDEVDAMLTANPAVPGVRKKLLIGVSPPWDAVRPVWQLRVGDFRVFYDVDEDRREVVVRAVRRKGTKTTKEIV
jgi:mRNA-degrading endonuclease RelE of RelBE toxin-antitoxin system